MLKSVVRLLAALGVVLPASASPLDSMTSLILDRTSPDPSLFRFEHREHRYYAAGDDALHERTDRVRFHFDGDTRPFSPIWEVDHRASRLHAEVDGVRATASASTSTIGVGFRAPNGYGLLLGPHRFELSRTDAWSVGWAGTRERQRIEAADYDQNWQAEFQRQPAYAYAKARTGHHTLGLRYGGEHRWRLLYSGTRLALRFEQERHDWPVLTDQWDGRTASVQRFRVDRRSLSGRYHPGLWPWLDALGLAGHRWEASAHGIFPFQGSPGGVQAEGTLRAEDIWVDLTWNAWDSRVLLRRARPEASGAHYSLYFPGLGERWPGTDVERAWLLGTRLEYAVMRQTESRLSVWAQQWWPLFIERSNDAGGSGGSNGGPTASRQRTTGGFQFGFGLSIL